jgi:hypothetical protein
MTLFAASLIFLQKNQAVFVHDFSNNLWLYDYNATRFNILNSIPSLCRRG